MLMNLSVAFWFVSVTCVWRPVDVPLLLVNNRGPLINVLNSPFVPIVPHVLYFGAWCNRMICYADMEGMTGWRLNPHLADRCSSSFIFFPHTGWMPCCKHLQRFVIEFSSARLTLTRLSLLQTCALPQRSLCWWFLYVGWRHMVHTR